MIDRLIYNPGKYLILLLIAILSTDVSYGYTLEAKQTFSGVTIKVPESWERVNNKPAPSLNSENSNQGEVKLEVIIFKPKNNQNISLTLRNEIKTKGKFTSQREILNTPISEDVKRSKSFRKLFESLRDRMKAKDVVFNGPIRTVRGNVWAFDSNATIDRESLPDVYTLVSEVPLENRKVSLRILRLGSTTPEMKEALSAIYKSFSVNDPSGCIPQPKKDVNNTFPGTATT
jgi:hypothetical protein